MVDKVAAALDELYGAAPADFIATRDALVKKLSKDPGVADLRGRRKPTQPAYALNQLARRHPDEVADLVDAGRALARAQRKALRGSASTDLREAITRQRAVIQALMGKAGALVKELDVDATYLPEIAAALQAALVDPAMGEALEAGRFERPPSSTGGFPFSDAEAEPPSAQRKKKNTAGAKEEKETAKQLAAQKRASETAAKAARAEAEKKAAAEKARADGEAKRLEATASAAARRADDLEAQAKEARKLAATARRRADEARAALEAL